MTLGVQSNGVNSSMNSRGPTRPCLPFVPPHHEASWLQTGDARSISFEARHLQALVTKPRLNSSKHTAASRLWRAAEHGKRSLIGAVQRRVSAGPCTPGVRRDIKSDCTLTIAGPYGPMLWVDGRTVAVIPSA